MTASGWTRLLTGCAVAVVAVTVPVCHVPATAACPSTSTREFELPGIDQVEITPTGVWMAGGGGSEDVRAPVLIGTDDEGSTWTVHCLANEGEMRSVFFHDEKRGWAGGLESGRVARLLLTQDGGRTWLAGRLPAEVESVEDVTFVDLLHGWAIGHLRRSGRAA